MGLWVGGWGGGVLANAVILSGSGPQRSSGTANGKHVHGINVSCLNMNILHIP